MGFGGGKQQKIMKEDVPVEDPSGWIIANAVAEFVLLHTVEINYMCMLGYTFFHGEPFFMI